MESETARKGIYRQVTSLSEVLKYVTMGGTIVSIFYIQYTSTLAQKETQIISSLLQQEMT